MEKKMRFSNYVKIRPYIGENYFNNSTKPKFLILGESAYDKKHKGDKDLLVNTITDIKNNKKTKYTKWPQTKRFYTKIYNLLNGENRWEDRASFWADVCFYDYIQEILDGSRQKVPSKLYKDAEKSYNEVIEKIKPDIIIVLGFSEKFNTLPIFGVKGKIIKIASIEKECVLTRMVKINRKIIIACRLQHPSSYGYKKGIWIKLFNKFLKEYKKGNLNHSK
jgi:hypothetical protein